MHQLAELGDRARFEHATYLLPKLFHKMQALEHSLILALGAFLLVGEKRGRVTRLTDEEKHEGVAKLSQSAFADFQRSDVDRIVCPVLLAQQTAIRSDVLILLANWLLQPVHLNIDRLLRKRFSRYTLAFVGI